MGKYTTVHKPEDYEVVEAVGKNAYQLHIFESRDQFTAWRKSNPHLRVKAAKRPKGRRLGAVDHRGEF